MSGQLRLSETQLSDLRLIAELSEEQLRSALNRLTELASVPMSQEEVRRTFSEALPDHSQLVEPLVRQVLALAGLQYRSDISHHELVVALHASLVGKLQPELMEAWNRVEQVFAELLQADSIRTVVKSLELSYDYANLIQSTNIVTDIRPIFDDAAEEVIGSVVSFTLRLSYQNGNNAQSLSLAFDGKDVEKLRDQCIRAMKKAETTKRHFSQGEDAKARIEISGMIGQ
jgi:hypothetical protein